MNRLTDKDCRCILQRLLISAGNYSGPVLKSSHKVFIYLIEKNIISDIIAFQNYARALL